MEQRHKLLAAGSSQAQGACVDSTEDRFSNLPDHVAHHILSLLNFRELTRLGSLSKRCREFCLSTPSLEFYDWGSNKKRHLTLLNSIERFLIRRGDNKIHHFRIQWNFFAGSLEVFRLMTWIHIAVRCNVEVVDLKLSLCNSEEQTIEFPSCIYLCGSLRSLSVDLNTILKAPSVAWFNNLEYLKFKNVRIVEGLCKWISYSCKCIKDLQFEKVSAENISIESSSLESFSFVDSYGLCHVSISGVKLESINLEWRFYKPSSSGRLLNIFAPNLKYLTWIGHLLNHQNLGSLMHLERAHVFLKHKGKDYDVANAFEALCSICRVKVLILSEDTTKLLLRQGSMHAQFDDISFLSMHTRSLTDDLVPAMVSLLRGMPNLNTLYLNSHPSLNRRKPKACGFKKKYWKTQNLECIHQLNDVSIELSNGFINNALELARYILEHAQNLKKMVILYLPHQSYVIGKVNKSKKVSTVTVVFRERDVDEDQTMSNIYYSYGFLTSTVSKLLFTGQCNTQTFKTINVIPELKISYQRDTSVSFPSILS